MRFFEQVYVVVRWIPRGRVASYGQIARLLGQPHAARTVGWAMQGLMEDDVPWHRVVNAAGRISIPDPEGAQEQRRRLEAEGVTFDAHGRIDWTRFGWRGVSQVEVECVLAGRDQDDED
jgi:methylated-DNA-protein-cysteine methyltransferase-like protein